jgi:uncharacterized membrane protein YuzA (DUF378 family)
MKGAHMYSKMNALEWFFFVLTVVGGINWGLIGIFDFNLVAEIFSSDSIQRLIYSLVGFATVGLIVTVMTRRQIAAED